MHVFAPVHPYQARPCCKEMQRALHGIFFSKYLLGFVRYRILYTTFRAILCGPCCRFNSESVNLTSYNQKISEQKILYIWIYMDLSGFVMICVLLVDRFIVFFGPQIQHCCLVCGQTGTYLLGIPHFYLDCGQKIWHLQGRRPYLPSDSLRPLLQQTCKFSTETNFI